jgi:hypothetical protein
MPHESGLLHTLLRLGSLDDVLAHPVAGASCEGFVIENLLSIGTGWNETGFLPDRSFIVYGGTERYTKSEGLEAIGLP